MLGDIASSTSYYPIRVSSLLSSNLLYRHPKASIEQAVLLLKNWVNQCCCIVTNLSSDIQTSSILLTSWQLAITKITNVCIMITQKLKLTPPTGTCQIVQFVVPNKPDHVMAQIHHRRYVVPEEMYTCTCLTQCFQSVAYLSRLIQ